MHGTARIYIHIHICTYIYGEGRREEHVVTEFDAVGDGV
jgi:hypothetical protein